MDTQKQTVQTQIRLWRAVWSGSLLFAIPSASYDGSVALLHGRPSLFLV